MWPVQLQERFLHTTVICECHRILIIFLFQMSTRSMWLVTGAEAVMMTTLPQCLCQVRSKAALHISDGFIKIQCPTYSFSKGSSFAIKTDMPIRFQQYPTTDVWVSLHCGIRLLGINGIALMRFPWQGQRFWRMLPYFWKIGDIMLKYNFLGFSPQILWCFVRSAGCFWCSTWKQCACDRN